MAFKLWRCFKIVIWRNFQHWLMTMVERLLETFGHWGVFNKFSFHFVAKIWEFQDWRWWGKECVVAVIVVLDLVWYKLLWGLKWWHLFVSNLWHTLEMIVDWAKCWSSVEFEDKWTSVWWLKSNNKERSPSKCFSK
jgi:hypothetical protein